MVAKSKETKDNLIGSDPLHVAIYTAKEGLNNQKTLNQDARLTDKYKHAYMSYEGAQNGPVGAATIGASGWLKEAYDKLMKKNTPEESDLDWEADVYGIKQGFNNQKGDCDELAQKKYKKYYR